jgi:hypothetical protein
MGRGLAVAAAPEREDKGDSHRKSSAKSPSVAATASVATIAAVAVTRVGSVPEEDEGHTGGAAAARPVAADAAAVATSDKVVIATPLSGRPRAFGRRGICQVLVQQRTRRAEVAR